MILENMITENPENTPSVTQGSPNLIREGGRTYLPFTYHQQKIHCIPVSSGKLFSMARQDGLSDWSVWEKLLERQTLCKISNRTA